MSVNSRPGLSPEKARREAYVFLAALRDKAEASEKLAELGITQEEATQYVEEVYRENKSDNRRKWRNWFLASTAALLVMLFIRYSSGRMRPIAMGIAVFVICGTLHQYITADGFEADGDD